MSWNYRIIRRSHVHKPDTINAWTEHFYQIHEVYYNKKGKPHSWTVDAVAIGSETKKDLKKVFKMQKLALKKPVLIEVKKKSGKGEKLVELK